MVHMGQRRHHYEQALEHYLRARRIPYVSVNEARKVLMPDDASFSLHERDRNDNGSSAVPLKSFDFVVYGEETNLLLEAKGRKIARRAGRGAGGAGRLESWVTQEDVAALETWQRLFGSGFVAAFVFVYWCDELPPAALFEDVFEFRGRWYALRLIRLEDYRSAMRLRSPRWRTVHLRGAEFERLSGPLWPAG